MKSKAKSREAAIATIQRIFQNTTEDFITAENIFKVWGRDLTQLKENKAWLANKLTALKYHRLILPVYTTENNRQVLTGIQLTLDGKSSLGRTGAQVSITNHVPQNSSLSERRVTIEDILKAIPRLQKENPDFEITFRVIPKE